MVHRFCPFQVMEGPSQSGQLQYPPLPCPTMESRLKTGARNPTLLPPCRRQPQPMPVVAHRLSMHAARLPVVRHIDVDRAGTQDRQLETA